MCYFNYRIVIFGVFEMDELSEKDVVASNRIASDEFDLPPEQFNYRDEGCELSDSCLLCPFPSCIREETHGKRRWYKQRRTREIIRLHNNDGRNVKELASIFRISQRTVYRVLKSKKESKLITRRCRKPVSCSAVDFIKQPRLK